MKILYLCERGPDYLADQLYVGLCKVLGVEQVVDYPSKPIYHEPGARLCYLPQVPGTVRSEDEIASLLRDRKIDLIVLSSPRAAQSGVQEVWQGVDRLPPCVVVDGEDDPNIRHEIVERFACRLYFKREYRWRPDSGLRLTLDRWLAFRKNPALFRRTFPLPFSVIPDALPRSPEAPRTVDISYAARASHPKRVRAWELLQEAQNIRVEGGLYADPTDRQSKMTTGLRRWYVKLSGDPRVPIAEAGVRLPYADYHQLLRRSKMALSIRGGGFDTLRYWEIAASGAVLVSEQPDIVIPNNFEHGAQALFCRPDLSDLISVIRPYLHDTEACAALGEAGYRHLCRFHTCERRAEYFLDLCRAHL